MNVITLNISLAVSNLLTLGLGALIVWALWYRDRRRRAKAAKQLRSAVHNLVFDPRKNSLVGNIVERIERGKFPAQEDFNLLDKVVNAALGVCRAPATSKLWHKEYRKRAFEAWMDEAGEKMRKEGKEPEETSFDELASYAFKLFNARYPEIAGWEDLENVLLEEGYTGRSVEEAVAQVRTRWESIVKTLEPQLPGVSKSEILACARANVAVYIRTATMLEEGRES